VTIYARAELIEKIRNGDAVVYALVHLKSAEKEERIDHQRVGAFVARHDDGTLESVRAEVNGSDDPPIIQITITKREDGT
jgi:VCBS repeat-containing protein